MAPAGPLIGANATYICILKPDPRAYQACRDGLGLPAEACDFVDDQARNIEGAVQTGWQAVWFDVRQPQAACDEAVRRLGLGRLLDRN